MLTIENDADGIKLNELKNDNGSTYDLQGRKMKEAESSSTSQLPKGIYIRNGKKVVIK